MAKFKMAETSDEDLVIFSKSRSSKYDSFVKSQYRLWKPREGKNRIRILPPPMSWKGAKHYALEIWVNYNVGVENNSYLSLSKMFDEPDPLLEAKREAERAHKDRETIRQYEPVERWLMWIIDRSQEMEGPQLWSCPRTVAQEFAQKACDDFTHEVIKIDNPRTGRDVSFTKTGTRKNTKYENIQLSPPLPLHRDDAVVENWLDFVMDNPIPETLQYRDYDYIASVFNGVIGGGVGENGDAEPAKQPDPGFRTQTATATTPSRFTKPADPLDIDDPPFDTNEQPKAGLLKPQGAPEPKQETMQERLRRRRAMLAKQADDDD